MITDLGWYVKGAIWDMQIPYYQDQERHCMDVEAGLKEVMLCDNCPAASQATGRARARVIG